MLVTLKTLQQQTFKIEVEPEELVKSLKEKIEKEKGPDVFPANGQKLIYAGKILEDDKAVSHYKIEEKNFVVVMVTKPKATPPPAPVQAPTPASATPEASAPAQVPAETPKSTPSATETAKSDEPSETASTTTTESTTGTVTPSESSSSTTTATESSQSQTSTGTEMSTASGESALVTGQDYEMIVNRIVNMGFIKEDVQRALRASFNNPDRAVEYLCGGIPDMPAEAPPESVPESNPPPAQQASAQPPAQPPAQSPAQQPSPVQQLQGPASGVAAGAGEDALAFLRSQPQFQHMRTLIQNRPDLLPELLQQIGAANPQLLQMISENQEQFISMLNEQEEGESAQGGGGSGGSGGGGGAPGGGSPGVGGGYIRITQQEKEAIDRLKALGFSEGMCIQAYFACEKNEELAANYLLSHGEDDDS